MQEEVNQEIIDTTLYTTEAETTPAQEPATRRVTTLTASRQRAYTADLMKAHVALMEKEVGIIAHYRRGTTHSQDGAFNGQLQLSA